MIRILDSFVADKIAAGEVIERPVSAVKELIENSIDAGSSSVIVEIKGGGISYIRITDDGSGIAFDEMETAFLRHATSKIADITDLDHIGSLGFRGEALSSISAISRITIVSRTSDSNTGTKMQLHAGKVISKDKTGANQGTTIIVEDIFYNTPARRKFLRSEAREASAVIELVQHYAICYSDIKFMMINNGNTLFTTAGTGDTASVITSIYKDSAHSSLLKIEGDGVKGYVSGPADTVSSRKFQQFYVNGRPVESKTIEKALMDAYGGRIFSGHPVAILFIDEDPAALDVNIHPAKKEILFLNADEVSARITKEVGAALDSKASIPAPRIDKTRHSSFSYERDMSDVSNENDAYSSSVFEQSDINEYLSSLIREKEISEDSKNSEESEDITVYDGAPNKGSDKLDISSLTYKGYVFDTYIITEKSDNIYIFDQHAAHERIYYEKFLEMHNSADKLMQPLISPVVINVSQDIYNLKSDIISGLTDLGYDISDFGSGSLIIRSIPTFMSAAEAEDFAKAFCDVFDEGLKTNQTVIEKLIMKSCKSAVKGGDRLSESEIKDLLHELSLCSNPYSCPHGRPTFITIGRYDAERLFKRR